MNKNQDAIDNFQRAMRNWEGKKETPKETHPQTASPGRPRVTIIAESGHIVSEHQTPEA